MQITIEEIEREYQSRIQSLLDLGTALTAEAVTELSSELFQQIKVKDISGSEDPENDMLLFQYGIYNWGNELGEHFSFDITRQLFDPEEEEPYQLSFTLIYEPELFKGIKSVNCWSSDFSSIDRFTAHIRTTEGFLAAEKINPKTYQLQFSQC